MLQLCYINSTHLLTYYNIRSEYSCQCLIISSELSGLRMFVRDQTTNTVFHINISQGAYPAMSYWVSVTC